MKNRYFALMALALVVFCSCQNDILGGGKYTPAQPGEEIAFGGTLQYENSRSSTTRTVYGDKGATGTEIKWYEGDMVRIYCEQATLPNSALKYCDYSVTSYIEAPVYDADGNLTNPETSNPKGDGYNSTHSTGLIAVDGNKGLCWGEGTHKIYGVYPSPQMLSKYEDDGVAADALVISENEVIAYLPNLQRPASFVAPKEANGNKHYTIHPSMRYAYMLADATTTPSNGVDLVFTPIVTAVEITLQNTGSFPIEGVNLVSLSSEKAICGDFAVKFDDRTITHVSETEAHHTVSIPVAKEETTIDLLVGDKLTFTAFMILDTDLSEIDVTLVYAGGVAAKKATLKGSGLSIVEAKKKNILSGIGVSFSKAVFNVGLDKWNASVSEETYLHNLSIPAAGGAASGHTSQWDSYETFLQQKLTVEQLWDQGIRCFEFTVDVNSTNDLSRSLVYCNTIPSDLTLGEAVEAVKTELLANPTEFAMVIITYQQNDGWDLRNSSTGNVTYSRSPSKFMSQLNSFWDTVSDGEWPLCTEVTVDGQRTITTGTALYNPYMSLNDARGKLFCIARPTSECEDNYVQLEKYLSGLLGNILSRTYHSDLPVVSDVLTNKDILVIQGWGAVKDKWERRGYTKSAFYRGIGNNDWNSISDSYKQALEYDGKPGRPFDVSTKENDTRNTISDDYIAKLSLEPDFAYDVYTSEGVASYKAWAQEWTRVSDIEGSFYVDAAGEKRDFFWANSTQEKLSNVITTLDKALGEERVGNTLYINSLCGYFISKDIQNSYLPNSLTDMSGYEGDVISYFAYRALTAASNKAGMSGDISRFSHWINNEFYNYLLTKELGGKSTGIILMDRVSNDVVNNPAGYYIPRIILANNPFGQYDEQTANVLVSFSDEPLGDGDVVAAPQHRGAMEVVWE